MTKRKLASELKRPHPRFTEPRECVRAWSVAIPECGCWIWLGATSGRKYGSVGWKGKYYRAHRFSWLAFRGQIPEGLYVLHRCDTPLCVNPNHLFIGTHKDNVDDMMGKGRHVALRGNNHPFVKVTDTEAATIRKMHANGIPTRFLANTYRVSKAHIRRIVSGHAR